MPELVLGPMLRYASQTEATVWVETDQPCEVQILGHTSRTFHVEGHHYGLVSIRGLAAGTSTEYDVALNGERRWPLPGTLFPASRIRTLPRTGPVTLVWGSCRIALPQAPPYTRGPDEHPRGSGTDALCGLAMRMRDQGSEQWPAQLLLLGDQVYADETSPATAGFIQTRRDTRQPPGDAVADFEEYARLYRDAWIEPVIRWLFSTVPTAMIFDDHDVHDDWNTSEAWVSEMRAQPWWHARITGALASYWLYQHLGNLSPAEVDDCDLLTRIAGAEDGGPLLRAFAAEAEFGSGDGLWSFARDIAGARLVVLDGRGGRVLTGDRREMFGDSEWRWLETQVTGGFSHLLIANTLPVFLPPNIHEIEAWDEAVCAGAWGGWAASLGERLRRAMDLEHWAAFQASFRRLVALIAEVGSGRRGPPPASILILGGDIHHAYVAEVDFPSGEAVRSLVYQAVCSPFRNPLPHPKRLVLNTIRRSRALGWIIRRVARTAGVRTSEVRWRLTSEPTFDNQLAVLELNGRQARLRIEATDPAVGSPRELRTTLARRLA